MITEQICLDIVRSFYLGEGTEAPRETSSTIEHGLPPARLIRQLLPKYSLSDIEAALRWLEYGEYVSYSGYGFAPRMVIQLTAKGLQFAQSGALDDTERSFVYQEDPYACFVARQFRPEDEQLFNYLSDNVLRSLSTAAWDGKAEGLDSFRGEIIEKIRKARFFICLLTHRAKLDTGSHASSVWLYQETGAAVALGKKPLVLVEAGMDDHYAGELQKTYEYIPFDRENFRGAFEEAGRRLKSDLSLNHIPLRTPRNLTSG